MQKKLEILVSNDDGIDSPGISALVHSLKRLGNVIVVAPDRQQSAVGHSLTISSPLRVTPFHRDGEVFGYSINGTPSDCVKLALAGLVNTKPDLVVSGINHGANTAVNILYSGTVSAATEGMLAGIPSMAISLDNHDYFADMSGAAEYAYIIANKMIEMNIPKGTFLNVNVPDVPLSEIKGLKVVSHNSTIWEDSYEKRKDPFGREYHWFSGKFEKNNGNPEKDDVALENKYVTLNPIHYDLTNYQYLDKLKEFYK